MKQAPLPLDVQDLLFKQGQISQIFDGFNVIPKACNLLSSDVKRGLLYVGHDNKINVVKPANTNNKEKEWKIELELPGIVSHVTLNCDCSLLAVCLSRPLVLIYNAGFLYQNKLELLYEIRLSPSSFGEVLVTDLKWNPAIPDTLCSVTSDHTIGCFQVKKDSKAGVQTLGLERIQGLQALCIAWSPKGKQLVVGCKDGSIIQLKPELKVARQIPGPQPFEGSVVSILWISNFQFCACYLNLENQCINVVIVDAPKGETTATFTTYEDVTFGSGLIDDLRYYFEHIPEWGIIIAASSHSSEVVVLGSCDNGSTWCQWQLTEGSAQLPLIRKEEIETFPMGIAVDKSSSYKLPWGPDATLPYPVPVLRIISTSGQLCSYHIINLKGNLPGICTPPTEVISAPPQQPAYASPQPPAYTPPQQSAYTPPQQPTYTPPQQPTYTPPQPPTYAPPQQPAYAPPLHVSFNLPTGATSTPRSKLTETILEVPKTTQPNFGESKNTNSYLPIENKDTMNANKSDFRMNTILSQGDSRLSTGGHAQSPVGAKSPNLSVSKELAFTNVTHQNIPQKLEAKNTIVTKQYGSGDSAITKSKDDNQATITQPIVKEQQSVKSELYDDTICFYAYCEEQIRFEKELKSRLALTILDCGTDEERQKLVEKSMILEEFLRELRETTNSLSSDIAYLKALLLQSFAWLEESKSKNSANINIINRSHSENNKLADLQRLFYSTQTQLIQATKVVDLEWAERTSQEFTKMNIPSIEKIYQTLIRHNQIITEEKNKIDALSKKWRNIGRGCKNISNLDESMSNLNISQNSSMQVNDNVIDLRCKMIANSACRFTREKQLKLRNLLLETEPKIIRASRPTELQDRLEATLSSLASKSKANSNKTNFDISLLNSPKQKSQNPISSLDKLVSGVGSNEKNVSPKNKSFTISNMINTTTPATPVNLGYKENIPTSFDKFMFGQPNKSNLSTPKMDTKLNLANTNISNNKLTSQSDDKIVNVSITSSPIINLSKSGNISNVPTLPKTPFSFSAAPTTTNLPTVSLKTENNPVFNFSTKSNSSNANQNPAASIDFSSLSFGNKSGITISPVSATSTSSTSQFKAPQASSPQNLFANTATGLTITPSKTIMTNPATAEITIGNLESVKKTILTPPKSQNSNVDIKLTSTPSTCTTSSTTTSTLSSSSLVTPNATSAPVSSTSPTASSLFSSSNFGGLVGATASLSFGSSKPSGDSTTQASTISPFSFSISQNSVTSTTASTMSASLSPSSASIFSGKVTTASGTTESAGNIFESKPAKTGTIIGASDATKPAFGTTPVFGSNITPVSSTSSNTTSIFGSNTKSTSASFGSAITSSSSVFGSVNASTTSMFGGNTTTTSSSVFGSTPSVSMFGSNSASTTNVSSASSPATTTSTIFGANPASTTSSDFTTNSTSSAASVFGTNSMSSATSIFGANTTSTAASAFGTNSTSTAASVFGTHGTSTTASIFSTNSAPTSSSLFGTSTSASTPVFGSNSTTTTSSIFSVSSTSTASSIFGAKTVPATTNSVFGSSAASPAFGTNNLFGGSSLNSSQPLFGNNAASAPTFGSPATTASTSLFGSNTSTNGTSSLFGNTATSTAAAPVFGSPSNVGGSVFGGSATFGTPSSPSSTGSSSVFGQSSTFGAKPVFGSPAADFGAAKMGFGSGFGSPQAFGSSPGFGSPPGLGNSSPLGGTNSMQKVFGESGGNMTFEALGSQSSGGLSFGSLVQKSPEAEKPNFSGGSSFSSWR